MSGAEGGGGGGSRTSTFKRTFVNTSSSMMIGGLSLVLSECSVHLADPNPHTHYPPSGSRHLAGVCEVLSSVTPSGLGAHMQLGSVPLVFGSAGFTTPGAA